MLLLKFARLLPVLAVFTLLAACGGETIIDLSDVSETATEADASETTSNTTEADASDTTSNTTEADPSETTSNSTEADASDTTSSSTEPTAVPATSAPEPTVAASESEEAIAPDQDATGSLDEDDVVVLENRDDAIALFVGEDFVQRDAECLADGAFAIFGSWDFIDADTTPAQDVALDELLDVCVTVIPGPAAGSPPPGTDAELDALWVACTAGSASACDGLYFDSPIDSDYEAYGYSCGGRTAIALCSAVLDG